MNSINSHTWTVAVLSPTWTDTVWTVTGEQSVHSVQLNSRNVISLNMCQRSLNEVSPWTTAMWTVGPEQSPCEQSLCEHSLCELLHVNTCSINYHVWKVTTWTAALNICRLNDVNVVCEQLAENRHWVNSQSVNCHMWTVAVTLYDVNKKNRIGYCFFSAAQKQSQISTAFKKNWFFLELMGNYTSGYA